MSIVVAGATGHLGRLVVERLLDRGVAPDEIVAAGRVLDRVADLGARGVRTAVFDYDDPAPGVLAGGDTFLLTSMPVLGVRVAQHRNALEAAAKAGVARVVYTSAPHADDTPLVLAPEHKATEELITASGVPYTIVRNNWYTENYAGTLDQARQTGLLVSSAGAGRVVEYRPVSPEEHLAILVGAGLDEATAGFVVAMDGNIRDGALADATPELARLAGRPTTPLLDAVRTMAAGR